MLFRGIKVYTNCRRFSDNTSLKQPRKVLKLTFFGKILSEKGFFMFGISTRQLMRSGIIAALYVVLSLLAFPIASGTIQIRVGEALTLLPIFFWEAIPGLFVGCFLINLITGCMWLDIIFGSLITLFAAIFTYFVSKLFRTLFFKVFYGGLFPVLLNAFFLPLVWYYCYGQMEYLYLVQVSILCIGQALSIYLIGSLVSIITKHMQDKGIFVK